MSSVLLHQEDEHRGYIEGKRRVEWGVGVDEGMIWVTWNEMRAQDHSATLCPRRAYESLFYGTWWAGSGKGYNNASCTPGRATAVDVCGEEEREACVHGGGVIRKETTREKK